MINYKYITSSKPVHINITFLLEIGLKSGRHFSIPSHACVGGRQKVSRKTNLDAISDIRGAPRPADLGRQARPCRDDPGKLRNG